MAMEENQKGDKENGASGERDQGGLKDEYSLPWQGIREVLGIANRHEVNVNSNKRGCPR